MKVLLEGSSTWQRVAGVSLCSEEGHIKTCSPSRKQLGHTQPTGGYTDAAGALQVTTSWQEDECGFMLGLDFVNLDVIALQHIHFVSLY